MTDLETLLREHFSAEAAAVPTQSDLVARLPNVRRRRRRHRLLGATAVLVAAVIAAAITVPVVVLGGSSRNRPDVVSPMVSASGPAVVARLGELVWAGIALRVPAGWAVGEFPCGSTSNAVIYPSYGVTNCPAESGTRPPVTTLRLGLAVKPPFPDGAETTFAGLPARSVAASSQSNFFSVTIYVPSRQATFTLAGPLPESPGATDVLRSARAVTSDAQGCPASADLTVAAAGPLPGFRESGKPQSPTHALVCAYAGSYLVGGRLVTDGATATRLAAAFGRAPARYTRTQVAAQQFDATVNGGPASCAVVLRAVVTFSYADGVSPPLLVQSAPCDDTQPGVSGARVSTLTLELGQDLAQVLPGGFYDGAVMGRLPSGCTDCALTP